MNMPAAGASRSLFGFILDAVEQVAAESPSLRFELFRKRFDRQECIDFSPLRMPDHLRTRFAGSIAQVLQGAELDIKLQLGSGTHDVPLAPGRWDDLRLSVPPQCQARLQAVLTGSDVSNTRLQSATLSFSPPIRLENPVGVLSSVAQLARNPLQPLWRQWAARFSQLEALRAMLGTATSSADLAVDVELRSLSVSAQDNGGRCWLKPAFSGDVRVVDRVVFPLDLVQLPGFALPHVPAELDELLQLLRGESATTPLTALLAPIRDGLSPATLLPFFMGLFRGGSGKVTAKLGPPPMSLTYATGEGSQRCLQVKAIAPLQIDAEFTLGRENNTLSAETTDCVLSSEDSHATVEASLAATIDLSAGDLSAGDLSAGDLSAGDLSAGDLSAGHLSAGDLSAGDLSAGHLSAGHLSAGDLSAGDLSAGDLGAGEGTAVGGTREPAIDLVANARVGPKSTLPSLEIELSQKNPLIRGSDAFRLLFECPRLEGGVRLQWDGKRASLSHSETTRLSTSLNAENSSLLIDAGDIQVETGIGGHLALELSDQLERRAPRAKQQLVFSIDFAGELEHTIRAEFTPIPELALESGLLLGQARSHAQLHLAPRFDLVGPNMTRVDLDGSSLELRLHELKATLDRRQLSLPKGTDLAITLDRGGLTPGGLQPAELELRWDMHGGPALMAFEGREVSLLTQDLRSGELTLHISETGRVRFSGEREGLYGVEYFNALLNPAENIEAWLHIFRSDEAIRHVLDTLSLFSADLVQRLEEVRLLVLTAREILRRERIKEVRDFLPRAVIGKVLSLLLVGDPRLEGELLPLIQEATEGHGIPLAEAKHLLHRELGEFDVDFEINIVLNWLSLVLRAGEATQPARATQEPPLALHYADALRDLPSANEIYQTVEQGAVDRSYAQRLAELAPELSLQQLCFLQERADAETWGRDNVQRLNRVLALKKRVDAVAEGYGGIDHAAQPFFIAAFLGVAVGPLPGINCSSAEALWPGPTALGPSEAATLLAAGLASPRQSPRTELNNRLLMELMARNSPRFTREMLIELAGQSSKALSGILFAFLEQDQDQMVKPIDLEALLSQKLGHDVPRNADYLAGGRRARHSYYEALDHLAEEVLTDADEYLARKEHLQRVRHPPAAPLVIRPRSALGKLEQRAQETIAAADSLAAGCVFTGSRVRGPRRRAIQAYQAAFESCAELLAAERRAFHLPWLKKFWARNENALRVLYAVRAYQEQADQVQSWLTRRTGKSEFPNEQRLLEAMVGEVFFFERDQRALLDDPLVRLLADPPPGKYDFSIISCMGVITEGEHGRELEDAFRRLHQTRGVRLLRAATGTGRSLEYNARRIIETIERCRTPWGIIGYSQGCANALLAESLLRSGTPQEQALLDSLVCRNLLFSAANGSAHGSSAMDKFTRAMVAGERMLKHYQATHSWEAIRLVLRGMRAFLDSPAFINSLGGSDSLSFERGRLLHRDGQFLDHVPTSHYRAVVEEHRLPECLEYLYYCLKEMSGGEYQDTQVLIDDAVGCATRVANDYTSALAACDMGSLVLASHHWAPLSYEIEFVKTLRDEEVKVYDGPKDLLLQPWVEVNARFGLIPRH